MLSAAGLSTITITIRSFLALALSSSSATMPPKLKHVPAAKLFASEPNPAWFGNPANAEGNPHWNTGVSRNWLKSRFHFSFAEYNNGKNSNYGVLRVMNDDFVQPARGFGTHGHSNSTFRRDDGEPSIVAYYFSNNCCFVLCLMHKWKS